MGRKGETELTDAQREAIEIAVDERDAGHRAVEARYDRAVAEITKPAEGEGKDA